MSEHQEESLLGAFATLAEHQVDPVDQTLVGRGQTYWDSAEVVGDSFFLVAGYTGDGSRRYLLAVSVRRAIELADSSGLRSARLFGFMASPEGRSGQNIVGEIEQVLVSACGARLAFRFRNGASLSQEDDETNFVSELDDGLLVVFPIEAREPRAADLPESPFVL